MSERLQIVCFLLWKARVESTTKVLFLSEIIYGAKNSVIRLVNSRRANDFCSRLLKVSNYSLENGRTKKDAVDILSKLKTKGYISIVDTSIELLKDFDGCVSLSYLPDTLFDKMKPLIEMTDESFLEEVIKYAKNY